MFFLAGKLWLEWLTSFPPRNLREWEWEWEFTGNGKNATMPWPFKGNDHRCLDDSTMTVTLVDDREDRIWGPDCKHMFYKENKLSYFHPTMCFGRNFECPGLPNSSWLGLSLATVLTILFCLFLICFPLFGVVSRISGTYLFLGEGFSIFLVCFCRFGGKSMLSTSVVNTLLLSPWQCLLTHGFEQMGSQARVLNYCFQ